MATLDAVLADRYERLFDIYYRRGPASYPWSFLAAFFGNGHLRAIKRLKDHLRKWADGQRKPVRPDALYFLLVTFNEMILIPYTAEIHGRNGRTLPPYRDYTPESLATVADDCLEDIQRALSDDLEEISGHAVMNAISSTWNELANKLGWG